MHEIESAVREIESDVQRDNREIRRNQAMVGQWLAEQPRETAGDKLATTLAQHDQLAAQIEQYDRTIQAIERLTEERGAAKERSTTLTEERADLTRQSEAEFTTVGECSFAVFRDNPLVDQEYADIFAPLLENYELLRDLDKQIEEKTRQVDERPFLDRMVERGRLVLLKNRRSNLAAQTSRLQLAAGRAISDTSFVEAIDDPRLTTAATPLERTITRIREIDGEQEALTAQISNIDGELASLGADRNATQRTQELRDVRAETAASLEDVDAEAGRLYLSNDGDIPRGLANAVKTTQELQRANDERRERIARLRAAQRVAELAGRIEAIDRDIQRKHDAVTRLNEEISALETKRAETDEARTTAEAQRGDPAELGLV